MNVLEVLSVDDVKSIHHASLAVLRDVGVQAPHSEVLEALADAGAKVDFSRQVAQIPEGLVVWALKSASKQYTLYGRDQTKKVRLGYGDVFFASSAGQYAWLGEDDGPRREPNSQDLRKAILVGDALPHIDMVGSLAMPLDVPTPVRDVYTVAELVKGTTKPARTWIANARTLCYILEIYEAAAGGKEKHRRYPMLAGFIEPLSPLRFAPDVLDILVSYAREGLPLFFGPMAQSGATAPATLAGTMVVENAEILASIVISQALKPGCPVSYAGSCHIMDMRTLTISFGSPEQALMGVAMTQMAQSYGLAVAINVGIGDSKRVDAQAGLEKGMTLLMGALAGADTFGDMGIIGADQGASLEQLIVDNEMIAYVKRILRGLTVNEETLALDAIKRVGIGGHFLADEHTFTHFRRELWSPEGFDRRSWEDWWADGAKSMVDWARERKETILTQHRPEPVDPHLAREIDKIVSAARKELVEV